MVDVLQPDIAWLGGLTEAKKVRKSSASCSLS
jgi:L-alanine-DL-glutamate epimerase-like enolase superfamily enzyme